MSKHAITHPGQAHRDEFIALCLLIAAGKISSISRRDPLYTELDNPDIYVVDVGGRHEPSLLNFDHHQFDRNAEPTCTITLVLEHLGIDTKPDSIVRKIWPWLSFSELIDSKGPFRAASSLGINREALSQTMSPVENSVLLWFQRSEYIGDTTGLRAIWDLMDTVGRTNLTYLNNICSRLNFLRQNAKILQVGGLTVVDATVVSRNDDPTMGLEIFCDEAAPSAAITVTQDDRGDGVTLFRRNDNPLVNFSKLDGMVMFAHKGGFIAKTHANQDWVTMLELMLSKR